MCAAIDMLSSSSPSEMFYGISPPAGFLSDYTPRRPTKLSTRGYSAPCLTPLKPVQLMLKTAPRSCLRQASERNKKNVVFADDRGYALEQVKFMTEPSYMPPYWSLKVVESPKRETPPAHQVVDLWETRFVQPASDYLEFRRRVTEDKVSLENVIVKQDPASCVDGTVKVKNLDFSKEVFIRASADGWTTHEDTFCAFVESGPLGKNGVSEYDTFGFKLPLPIHSRRLDFCVCFQCKGTEYWDNNKGTNYTIEKSSVRNTALNSCARIKFGNSWTARSDVNGNTPYW